VARIEYACHPELKVLLVREAGRRQMTMNELLSEIVAASFSRPDLARIPRKPPGRKPQPVA